jgi:hypothetical protein
MMDLLDQEPFGIIFIGPPGFFAAWMVTPNNYLIDRESAELLGLYAVHAGASDYRTFPLEERQKAKAIRCSQEAHGQPCFITKEELTALQQILLDCGGLPFASHQPLDRR